MPGSDWLQTYTGRKFYPLDPDPELICVEDIAHALSNICRYGGHSQHFYSVAQHSVLLAENFFAGWQYKLVALFHDAAEAYLGDIPRPLKRTKGFDFYREAEDRLQGMIFEKLCGFYQMGDWWHKTMAEIKKYDTAMIAHESCVLLSPLHPDWSIRETIIPQIPIEGWYPSTAKGRFLELYTRLISFRDRKEAA